MSRAGTTSTHQSDSHQSRGQHAQVTDEFHPKQDLVQYAKAYAREKPEVAALWCFGVGFILGWKLKPW